MDTTFVITVEGIKCDSRFLFVFGLYVLNYNSRPILDFLKLCYSAGMML